MMNEELFWGEFIVRDDGIYTKVHKYHNKGDGRIVFLVGTNHAGDGEYYKSIDDVLAKCDIVLYEKFGGDDEEKGEGSLKKKDRERRWEYKRAFSSHLNTAFLNSLSLYFNRVDETMGLVSEWKFFEVGEKCCSNWYCADPTWDEVAGMEEEPEPMRTIPDETKKELAEYFQGKIRGIDEGRFSKKEFGESFVMLYKDPVVTENFLGALGRYRDIAVLKKFDSYVKDTDARIVGIKFGAAHMEHQQRLLKERGYEEVASWELCNIKF